MMRRRRFVIQARPHRVAARHYRRYVMLWLSTPLGAAVHAAFVPLLAGLDLPRLAAAHAAGAAAWALAFVANHRGRHTLAAALAGLDAAAQALLADLWLGPAAGFHYYLWPVACLAVLAPRMRPRFSAPFGLGLLGLFTALELAPGGPPSPLAAPWPTALAALNIGLSAAGLVMLGLVVRSVNESQERNLTEQATRDALTGLYNRHFATDFLRQLGERNRRTGEASTLALGDLDHFKAINDRHGHDVGDDCLIAVAERLQAHFRASDCLCRWGGEEFLIVLPGTTPAEARSVLERFAAALRGTPDVAGTPIRLTMSFGATLLAPGEAVERALERADRLLYRAKALGRDRIVGDDAP
ncbi:GGDEF domain-containing protein [Halomonas koreensis]|uniref:diguanylate cyclase n=1 Tax=Halomonas koreensis TaxID=245385 RepID=A0ABU1G1W5_9GAMM|nr:GGDEF domain-containing protein [Halomonas koreensis]MDR5866701.1 GGDEF domain-containing protein [Halomonas koreensis]